MALENRALYSASLEKLSGISTTLADFLSAPSGGKVSRISKPEAPAPAEPGPALAAAPCASRSGRAVLAGGLKALATVRPPRPSPLPPLPASSSSCRGAALLLDDQASFAAAVASGGLGTFGTCGTPSARGRCPVAISSATFCLLAAPMGSSERRQARISSSLRPCACRTCCCACCACCGSCLAASPPAGRGAATNANAAVAARGCCAWEEGRRGSRLKKPVPAPLGNCWHWNIDAAEPWDGSAFFPARRGASSTGGSMGPMFSSTPSR
mmetsp:Transcript_14324/g.45551  ORF Transcript_14324/g.45551 Transcript_14324/m.45551 type:complete len:269 (-) Transcript_14324:1311-2117(-)